MGLAIFAFIVLFLLLASGGLLLFYRQAMMQRISNVIMKRENQQGGIKNAIQHTGSSLGVVLEQFKRVLPKSQAEVSVVQQRLIRAGYRSASAIKAFYGIKVLTPVALCVVVLASGIGKSNLVFICGAALGLGFLVPDFALGKMIKTRQAKVRLGLTDVLDLLVICI